MDRAKRELRTVQQERVAVIDFFCGCGGTSRGFQMAQLRSIKYDIIAGIDCDPACCKTFETSIHAKAYNLDIRQLEDKAALTHFKQQLDISRYSKLVLIGCAPCQGFSAHRRNVNAEDIRKDLFVIFCRLAAKFSPDAILMENVPDLFSIRNWPFYAAGLASLRNAGYQVQGQAYNFAQFGLPQERFRAVIIASKTNAVLPKPVLQRHQFRTVRQAIGDLPPLRSGEKSTTDPMHWVSQHRASTVAILRRVPKDGGNRPLGVGPKCLDKARDDHGGFTDVYGRLSWDKPAVTLTGKCRTPSAGRFAHPQQNRGLSIREAALLQGFPIDFTFEGNFDSRYQQIGNAVPPSVAKVFAEHLGKHCLGKPNLVEADSFHEDISLPVGPGFAIKINGFKKRKPIVVSPNKPTAVDLFCGAGGLSLGLKWAGFRILGAIDNDPAAVESYKRNLGPHVVCADLQSVTANDVKSYFGVKQGDLTLIAGGPPCQGFSVKRTGSSDDPRNALVLEFIRLVAELKPRFFLLENVPGLKSKRGENYLSKLIEEAEHCGYRTHVRSVEAAEYGIPQMRRRTLVVGEHRDYTQTFQFPIARLAPENYRTVADAIRDLPSPPFDGSPHPVIFNHYRESRLSPTNLERIRSIPEGGGREFLPPHLALKCHGNSKIRHVDTYGRLSFDQPSVTITARFDSFTRGRFGHPVDDRTITLREGARIQTFPDEFVFFGNREQCARQIGNAVPPLLAKIIGEQIIRALTSTEQTSPVLSHQMTLALP